MSEPWRVLIEDPVRQKVVVHEAEIFGAAFEDTLNRPGSISGKVPLSSSLATREVLSPGRRAFYVMKGTRIYHGGILWDTSVGMGSEDIDLGIEGWLGYWDHRRVVRSRNWLNGVDPFHAIDVLLFDAQNPADNLLKNPVNLGIEVVWDNPSGAVASFAAWDYEAKSIGEIIRSLADDYGFDMVMEYTLTNDQVEKRLRLTGPYKGRDFTTSASHRFEFEYDGETTSRSNVLERGLTRTAADMEWRVRGWGKGSEGSKARSFLLVDETMRSNYLPTDGAPSFSDLEGTDLFYATASYHRSNAKPVVIPSLRVDPNLPPYWGSYELGDMVQLEVRDRYATYLGPARIFSWRVDMEADIPELRFEEVPEA
jgi:hypothetical protein